MTTRAKKIMISIVVATLALFAWGGFSHMVLLSGAGFERLPNEDQVITAMSNNLSKQGLYFFPGKSFSSNSQAEENRWLQKFKSGPAGILVYRPVGGNPFSASKLLIQGASNLLSVVIAVLVVSQIKTSYWHRVGSVALLGLLACTAVSTIYWNWYEFPTAFFLAQLADLVTGFTIVGLIISKIIPATGISGKEQY